MNAAANDPNSELQRPDLRALGEAISIWFEISRPLPRLVIGFLSGSGQEIFKSCKVWPFGATNRHEDESASQIKAFRINQAEDDSRPLMISRLLTTAVATKCKEI